MSGVNVGGGDEDVGADVGLAVLAGVVQHNSTSGKNGGKSCHKVQRRFLVVATAIAQ